VKLTLFLNGIQKISLVQLCSTIRQCDFWCSQSDCHSFLPDMPVEVIPHVEFKKKTKEAKALVRLGEFTSYANVILVAGVM
jgi:D-ribose pyranose/furanose isomerase RbsD